MKATDTWAPYLTSVTIPNARFDVSAAKMESVSDGWYLTATLHGAATQKNTNSIVHKFSFW
jgi:hypothetical protein